MGSSHIRFRNYTDASRPEYQEFFQLYDHTVAQKLPQGFGFPHRMRDWELYQVMTRIPAGNPEIKILETGSWSTYTAFYLSELSRDVVVSDSFDWAKRAEYTEREVITPVDEWKRVIQEGAPEVKIEDVDIQAIPHDDHSFDYITSVSTIEHVSDPHKALAEMYRCLKPGGKLLLTTDHSPEGVAFDGNDQFFSMRQLEELFSPYGATFLNQPDYSSENWCYDRTDVCIIILFVEINKAG